MSSNERRIEELEVRLAFQDDLVGSLNGIVASLQRDVDRLTRELKQLRDSVADLRVGSGADVRDEPPPPHY